MTLAEFILQYCRQHQISKTVLAEHADIGRSTIYDIVKHNKTPTVLNLIKLAIAMQVHPQYLIELEWKKLTLADNHVTPIDPLIEPELWFDKRKDNSHFIAETIPDGSLLRTGETFVKTWRIQNTGTTVWKNRYLVCQDADISQENQHLTNLVKTSFYLTPEPNQIPIPTTLAGQTVDLSVTFTAPTTPCTIFSQWKMVDEHGQLCFPDCLGVYVLAKVISAGSAVSL